MKNLSYFLIAECFLLSLSCAQTLPRDEHKKIIKELKTPSETNQRVSIITDENFEVPDPTRPLMLELPDGKTKYVIGFSGQNIMLVDSLKDLIYGGLKKTSKVQLLNKFGHQYGGEINPSTGKPFGYSEDSSTWDVAIFKYTKTNGEKALRVLAGAMGTGLDGKPFLVRDGYNNTRQRLFFDAEFRGEKLHASNPKAILNSGEPEDGNWIQRNSRGEVVFSHGYGGEPVTLLNGDLFTDRRGWVPFIYETVVEQRNEPGPIPYRTAIVVTYLDKTLSRVMSSQKIILDVFRRDGKVFKAAERPTAGPLVEGPHIEVQHNGKAVESNKEAQALIAQGARLDFQMLFSAGEYFGTYGSYMAFSRGNLESFEPVLDDHGELLDLTAPLRVLFTWIGRPVSFHAEGKEYLLLHGVDRTSLPEGFVLDQIPKGHEWPYYKRQELIVPVEREMKKNLPVIKIKDDRGLIERLKKFVPRKVSETILLKTYKLCLLYKSRQVSV